MSRFLYQRFLQLKATNFSSWQASHLTLTPTFLLYDDSVDPDVAG